MDLPGVELLAYLTVFTLAALDIFLPVLPADGTIVAAGTLTVTGQLDLPLVIAAGLAGAWTGDFLCYHVGRGLFRPRRHGSHRRPPSNPLLRRFAALRGRIDRSIPALFDSHPNLVLVACRLIPGGRTAGALAAGRVAFARRRFALVELCVATGWASYETLLGYLSARFLPAGTNAGAVMPLAEAGLFVVTLTVGVRLWHSLVVRMSRPGERADDVGPAEAPTPDARPRSEPPWEPSAQPILAPAAAALVSLAPVAPAFGLPDPAQPAPQPA